jgi:hypothetical protein
LRLLALPLPLASAFALLLPLALPLLLPLAWLPALAADLAEASEPDFFRLAASTDDGANSESIAEAARK